MGAAPVRVSQRPIVLLPGLIGQPASQELSSASSTCFNGAAERAARRENKRAIHATRFLYLATVQVGC